MSTCEVRLDYDSEGLCDQPASHRVTGGCVHEHLLTLNLCSEDWAEYQRTQKLGVVYCLPCEEAGLDEPVEFVEVIDLEETK